VRAQNTRVPLRAVQPALYDLGFQAASYASAFDRSRCAPANLLVQRRVCGMSVNVNTGLVKILGHGVLLLRECHRHEPNHLQPHSVAATIPVTVD